MANQIINLGTGPNTHDGDGLRTAFGKANQNFAELYARADGSLRLSGGTLTGTLTLASSTANAAALILPAGQLLTTPVASAVEFDGSTLYVTTSGGVRKAMAFAGELPSVGSFNSVTTGSLAANTVSHGGLVMTSGTAVDQLHTSSFVATLTSAWQDTGVKASTLATGTYFVQMLVNNSTAINEYYSGVMSWFATNTDDTVEDEIILHRAGNRAGSTRVYLKTVRTLTASVDDLKLQIAADGNAGSTTVQLKFRRMI